MICKLAVIIAATAALIGGAIAADAPPVKIGFSIAKTGLFATATQAQLNAYHFWRDQITPAAASMSPA